jgi:WD40 repeat protein
LKKTYLINLISSDKPPNLTSYFISKEDGDKMLEEAKQKMNVFKGFSILEKLIKDNQFKQSVAPAIGIKKKSMNNYKSGVSTSCSQTKSTESYNVVMSTNVFDDISFQDFNQYINKMDAIEEEEDIKEYHNIKTLNDHQDKVVSLIQLHSGLIATGSYDSTIRIWDVEEYRCVKIFKIKETTIFCLLEFIPNFILFGTNKNNIGLWDSNSEDNRQSYIFSGHQLWVNSLVKCDDNCFASASNDQTIKIWNYYNKNCIRTIEAHEDCILCLIKLINGNLCSGSADLMIKIWDWNNGSCLYTLVGHQNWIQCLIQLEDGQIVSGSVDKTIKFWKKYENIKTIENAHENSVRTLCQINANYIASGSFDNKIKIWNLNNLKCHQILSGHKSNVTGVIQLNKNNLVSCSTDYTIKIWG